MGKVSRQKLVRRKTVAASSNPRYTAFSQSVIQEFTHATVNYRTDRNADWRCRDY